MGRTTFWDPATGQRQTVMEGQRTVALSADGQTLLANDRDGVVRLFDRATHQENAKLWQSPCRFVNGALRPLHILSGAFSADGQTLAIGLRERFLIFSSILALPTRFSHLTGSGVKADRSRSLRTGSCLPRRAARTGVSSSGT